MKNLIPKLKNSFSIIIVGCGGIVEDAHIPAYQLAGYKIEGLFDRNAQRVLEVSQKFNIEKVFSNREEIISNWKPGMIFDVAVPAKNILEVIEWLPADCCVLFQKPLGENLLEASKILSACKKKSIRAAVNFQLRYAPNILKAKKIIKDGLIGEIRDVEVRVTCNTPWNLWSFLFNIPRVEVLYHSIHYIDLIRSFCGNPQSVLSKTIGTPEYKKIKDCRSNIILDYGNVIRANIETNHTHNYGNQFHESYFKCEGTQGALKATLGVNLNYPEGRPDDLLYYNLNKPDKGWQNVPIVGNWFPHAFIGSMGSVFLSEDGQIDFPETQVRDAFETMAVVEAVYDSSNSSGTPLDSYLSTYE